MLVALQLKELLSSKFKSLQDFNRYNAAKPAREEAGSHVNGTTSGLSVSSLKPSSAGTSASGGAAAAANGATAPPNGVHAVAAQ